MNTTTTTALKLSLLALFALAAGCAAEPGEEPTEEVGATEDAIVGGTTTSAYPAVGALTRFGQAFCTATVIGPRTLVTAAHCLDGQSASRIKFALGPRASAPTASLAVKRIAVHPEWNPSQIKNDIGVVILAQDAPVAPVAVNAAMSSSWVGTNLVFVGYGVSNGQTQTGGGIKRVVTIPVSQVAATQFAYQTPGKNTCNGDSGGPAFAVDESGGLTIVGVTSYGDRGCTQYGVDTRVDAYRSFIASVPTN